MQASSAQCFAHLSILDLYSWCSYPEPMDDFQLEHWKLSGNMINVSLALKVLLFSSFLLYTLFWFRSTNFKLLNFVRQRSLRIYWCFAEIELTHLVPCQWLLLSYNRTFRPLSSRTSTQRVKTHSFTVQTNLVRPFLPCQVSPSLIKPIESNWT